MTVFCECCLSKVDETVMYDIKYIEDGQFHENIFCNPCYSVLESTHNDGFSTTEIVFKQEYRSLSSVSNKTSTH